MQSCILLNTCPHLCCPHCCCCFLLLATVCLRASQVWKVQPYPGCRTALPDTSGTCTVGTGSDCSIFLCLYTTFMCSPSCGDQHHSWSPSNAPAMQPGSLSCVGNSCGCSTALADSTLCQTAVADTRQGPSRNSLVWFHMQLRVSLNPPVLA